MSNISPDQVLASRCAVILGAPASGKTALLLKTVASLERAGNKADEILVLTPSRLAANSLRDQIGLNSQQANKTPRARSLSSFAFGVARASHPELTLISGAQQQQILSELIAHSVAAGQHLKWGLDRATTLLTGFHQEVRDLMSVLVENQLDGEGVSKVREKFDTKGLRVAQDLLPRYLERAKKLGSADTSELLLSATELIDQHNSPKFVLVDDAQDLSPAGLELISRLKNFSNCYLFGDPDVSIASFRSSGQSFLSSFPDFARLQLSVRYENAARSVLMPRIAARIPTGLASEHRPKPTVGEISAELFDNPSNESDWLAAQLRQARLVHKLDWDQMAVVARTRVQLDQIAQELTARSVPVRILGVQQPLRSQISARAVLDFGALAFGLAEVDREQLISHSYVGLDALGAKRLFRELSQNPDFPQGKHLIAKTLFDTLVESESFEVKKLNRATELRYRLSKAEGIGAYEYVSAVVELMPLERLKTLARGRGNVALAANRELDSVLELIAAAQRFDLRVQGAAADFVRQQLELGIPEDSLAPIGLRPAVTLATSSQLAGKKFELLAIPRLQEGIWPNLRARSALLGASSLQAYLSGRLESPVLATKSELHDELRLFYKAVGAASGKLLLSASQAGDETPSQFFTMFQVVMQPNSFAMEFDLRLQVGKLRRRAIDGDASALPLLAALALAGAPGAHPKNWQGLIELSSDQNIFASGEQKRMSASKLEAFEKCPLHWFISTFAGETGNFQASLGTLMHAALEATASGTELREYVESNWHTLEFESQWYSLAQQRKSARMVAMLNEYLSKSSPLKAAEQAFEFGLGELVISGKIDRIESSPNGLLVVDLKTGKAPTKEEVARNRQLGLYQMALLDQGEPVSGARIVSVGGESLRVLEQSPLDDQLRSELNRLLERADIELAGKEFVAAVSVHCAEDSDCQLLLARSVQNG